MIKLMKSVRYLFIFSLLISASHILAAGDADKTDIEKETLSGGHVGALVSRLTSYGTSDHVRWQSLHANGVCRSLGRYSFNGVSVGEIVLRCSNGTVREEYIDFPLVGRDSVVRAPEATGVPSASANQSQSNFDKIKSSLESKFGAAKVSYSVPGRLGESGRSVQSWKAGIYGYIYRLEAFFSDDNTYLVGKTPHFARLTILAAQDLESLILDPSLFLIRDYELIERFALCDQKLRINQPIDVTLLGAKATLKVTSSAGTLRGVEIEFKGTPGFSGIVTNKYKDRFLNVINEVITQRLRSLPKELRKNKANYYQKSYLVYDATSDSLYEYSDTFKYFTTDVALVWSPGSLYSGANYRVHNRTLEIIPASYDATDITTLGASSGFSSSAAIKDFNLPALGGLSLKSNVRIDRNGTWISVPMEDQGELPFCLPASMARLMRYFGRQVNQYSLAQVGGTDMRGTDWKGMKKIFYACAEKFGFKIAGPKEGAPLSSFIKHSIDNGIPILWLVPGHARIINGYDARSGSVIYTDSWGAGFELQKMPYHEAEKMTDMALILLPPVIAK